MLRYFFIFFLLIAESLWAEYRVFELEITAYAEETVVAAADADTATEAAPTATSTPTVPPEELSKRVVLSTLDPQQYRGYHIVQPNEKIRYISTWRCRGRTGNKDYCPNPKAKTEAEDAAIPSENK